MNRLSIVKKSGLAFLAAFVLASAAAIFATPSSCLGPATAFAAAGQGDIHNPSPADGDFVLPGPGGSKFVFRPVKIKGEGLMAGARFIMGDPSGDFRAPPTAVVVGGAFAAPSGTGGKDGEGSESAWVYYLGKYEITEAQYYAVMGLPDGVDKAKLESDLPMTQVSYFDAIRFADALNTWLYANALDKLPVSGPFPGFVRLPTEVEWEYAARGGGAVEALVFDTDYPYDDLTPHEWFAGPQSSHNKLQPIGRLLPNPLGLHDMLGNVREITQTHYQIEYYQGRSGGFTARGGHYLMEETGIISAARAEEPYYLGSANEGMRPNTKPTMGFRLAISAPILTDRATIARMEDDFDEYRAGAGANLPAALSVSDISAQEAVPAQEALVRLNRIKEALASAGLADSLKQDIGLTEAALLNMTQVRKQADEDSARVWAKIAGERGMYLAVNLQGLALAEEAPTENLRRRAEQYAYNVEAGLENYGEIMAELAKLPPEAVKKGFEWYVAALKAKIDKENAGESDNAKARVTDLNAQLDWLATTKAHYEKYAKEKRFDAAAWRNDYAASADTK